MLHIIINPAAGAGRALKLLPLIEKELNASGLRYVILITTRPMDAKRLSAEACEAGSSCIVCVGGDGTLHETVSGMVGSGVPLGIIPAGSGNDFISSVGLGHRLNIGAYVAKLKAMNTKAIDVIRCGEFYSVNVASVGLDASIVETAAKLKNVFARYAYVASTVANVFTFKNFDASIKFSNIENGTPIDNTITTRCTLIAACNGSFYGGGFRISPSAKPDDGLITLCVIKNFPTAAKALLFPLVLAGKHMYLPGVEFYDCNSVTIMYEGVRHINFDGNLYTLKGPLTLEIIRGGLRLVV